MQALHGSDSKYLSRRQVLSQRLVKHADLQDSTNRKTFNKVYNFATKKYTNTHTYTLKWTYI
jgi:hypothetical protein